jgi:hypothetical protein
MAISLMITCLCCVFNTGSPPSSPTATTSATAANTFRHTQPLHKANTLPPLQKKFESPNNTISISSNTNNIAVVKPTAFQQKLAQAKCIHLSCYTSYTADVTSEQYKRARSSKKRLKEQRQQQQQELQQQQSYDTTPNNSSSVTRVSGASVVNIAVPALILAGDSPSATDTTAER